ncbi:MAG: sodium:solute symporter family protein [Acidobacteriota bacterium]|jgi:high affinity choline transporter 7
MPTPEGIHWGGLVSLLVFYALIYWLGRYAAQRKSDGTAEDLMLARRSVPLWIGVFTMSATWVGGGYINGTAEATYGSGLVWVQAPWGYALSLVVGGLFFARIMRRHRFATMLDPLEARFGKKMAAVLYLPALSGEIFWTGAILTALGTTFGTVLGLEFGPSIILSAAVAIAYTLVGGLWAVAFTDVLQLLLFLVGLWLVVPLAAGSVGGLGHAWSEYSASMGGLSLLPPWRGWQDPAWGDLYWNWWDSALLLIFGGVPWHVYFQRVLSARDEDAAARLSLLAAGVCLVAAVPAVLIGVIGQAADWSAVGVAPPEPALVLPYVLRYLTGPVVASIGLGALAAAVMSSVDSSILSASSMGAWNIYRPLVRPGVDSDGLARVIRRLVLLVGTAATLIALRVQSVYALWFLCSDLVYCILFPQLVTALYDRKANRDGAIAGLVVSAVLRFGGGEPVLGIPRLLPYPMVDASGAVLFPFRTTAMLAGVITIVVVSRLTQRRCPPCPLAPDTGSH